MENELKQNIIDLEQASDIRGDASGDSPATMSDAFSASKNILETHVSLFGDAVPSGRWQVDVLPKLWTYNLLQKPPLSNTELHSLYDHLLACKIDSEQHSLDQEVPYILSVFDKNKTEGTYAIAEHIVKKYDIITVGEREKEIFVYRDGIYSLAENEVIFPEVQSILKEKVTKNAKSETLHKVQDRTMHPRSIFQSTDLRYIPLHNGVYDFETGELLPHSPSYKFKYKFPIICDEYAHCPKTFAFFEQILTSDQIDTVQEWLGYYFYRLYSFKKAIIFVGEGDTGKTTLLEVIIHLLGKDNISSVPLQKMSVDKFSAAHLYEKHGNIVDELSAKDIADTGNFKIATGGGSITGEYKFGNQFSFANFSKFTFACNKIPDVKDFEDDAYFNRWMVIRFENKIEKKIPNFIATLATEEERSGLFNWSMIGLKRLLAQGCFTYANTEIDTKLEMMRSSSSAGEFCAKCVIQQSDSEVTKEDMYEAYVKYCTENKLSIYSKKAFGQKFVTLKYISEAKGYDDTGKRAETWKGVALIKNTTEIKSDEEANAAFDMA